MNTKGILFTAAAICVFAVSTANAQDDSTTRNAASAYGGGYITGPASNPLSFLNGPAYRTFASTASYPLPDFKPATLLNDQLPRWLRFGLEERFRYERFQGAGFKNSDDAYMLNRFRLQMTLRPTSWFKLVAQTQDARPFLQTPPYGPPNEVKWDLKLAYAEFGNPETSWISLRVGRQAINYNNTIIATSEWRNQGRSYDAVAVNLHYDRYRLGIFAASQVVPLISGVGHHQDGNNIYGLYGTIDRVLPNASLEPFVLWRVQPSVAIETAAKIKTARQSEEAYGVRLKGVAAGSLDYSYEAVLERGANGPNSIRAWAQTTGAGYRFRRVAAKPRAFIQYDYASGDKNPNDGVHGAFDTMYPTTHDRFGIADQFGWQNIVAARGGLTFEPIHRWTLTGQYLNFWLASATDSVYNISGGSIARDATGRAGRHLAEEWDAYTWFELNRHMNFGVGMAHVMPGSFLAQTTKHPAYNYSYFAINFKDYGAGERK